MKKLPVMLLLALFALCSLLFFSAALAQGTEPTLTLLLASPAALGLGVSALWGLIRERAGGPTGALAIAAILLSCIALALLGSWLELLPDTYAGAKGLALFALDAAVWGLGVRQILVEGIRRPLEEAP